MKFKEEHLIKEFEKAQKAARDNQNSTERNREKNRYAMAEKNRVQMLIENAELAGANEIRLGSNGEIHDQVI